MLENIAKIVMVLSAKRKPDEEESGDEVDEVSLVFIEINSNYILVKNY